MDLQPLRLPLTEYLDAFWNSFQSFELDPSPCPTRRVVIYAALALLMHAILCFMK